MDDDMHAGVAETLGLLQNGQTLFDLSDELTRLVAAVMATGRAGQVSLVLKVKPNGNGKVLVLDEVKSKIPQPPRKETVFFANEDGHLTRRHPKQAELEFEQDATPPADAPLRKAE